MQAIKRISIAVTETSLYEVYNPQNPPKSITEHHPTVDVHLSKKWTRRSTRYLFAHLTK